MKFHVMRLSAHDSCHVAVLQCVAVCCSLLQYVAVCYSVLQCVEACMIQATLNQVRVMLHSLVLPVRIMMIAFITTLAEIM